MCALRNVRSIDPAVLATSYRFFEGKPHRLEPRILRRNNSKLPTAKTMPKAKIEKSKSSVKDTDNSEENEAGISDESGDGFDYDDNDEGGMNETEQNESSEDLWLATYLTMCKKLKILPISSLKTGLKGKDLTLKFTKVGISDLTALCVAIKRSDSVNELNFEDNALGSDGGEILAQAINDNEYLTTVRLVSNNLMSTGLRPICKAVVNALNLVVLDVSDNGITESGAEYLSEMIVSSESLQELYLSKNNIMPKGTTVISKALMSSSCSLRVLDLSWNHIRLTGSKAIGIALEKNKSLEKINLAWNGLHVEGAVSIRDALRKNSILEELDLTCNRMTEVCIDQLLIGLKKNTKLEIIHLGQNHLTCMGALRILEFIRGNKNSGLKVLDLGTQEVNEYFISLYEELRAERNILVIHGPVHVVERKSLSSRDVCDEEKLILRCNPLTVLMECMRLQNYRLLKAFQRIRKVEGKYIDLNELRNSMIQCDIPLTRHTMSQLLEKLDTYGNSRFDYNEMVKSHGLHQKLVRQYLIDGSKFEETDIGRVSLLLCKLINKNLTAKASKEGKPEKETKPAAPRCKNNGDKTAK